MGECGWDWSRCLETPSMVSAAVWESLPMVYLRRAWPLAQLAAMLGNVNGGKSDGGKKMDARKTFSPLEFVPWYARAPGFELPAPMLAPHHCAALVEAVEAGHLQNSSWVLQVVGIEDSWERVLEAGHAYLEQQAGEPGFGG
ncbi:hypothetical protein [Deinococcus sp. UYEF24]